MIKIKYNHLFLATIIIGAGFFLFPNLSQAASLQISTDKSQYKVGDTISARVTVSSQEAINALSGSLTFSTDKVRATAVSKSGSIISLWVKNPSFSNSGGNASFEGVIPNPGFTGTGRVVSVSFLATAPGTATFSLSNGSILANDGQGTDVLTGLGRASITIIDAPAGQPEPTKAPTEVTPTGDNKPQTPIISSLTTPDSNKWYNPNYVTLNWALATDITDVSYVLDNQPNNEAPNKSIGLMDSFTPPNGLSDGIWYFHLKVKNKNGWSANATFVIHIDTINPDALAIDEAMYSPGQNRARFIFDGSDKLSGVDYFEFKIDNQPAQPVHIVGLHNYYDTPYLSAGEHTLTFRVIDLAGNANEKQVIFQIKPAIWSKIFTFLSDNFMSVISIAISLIALLLTLVFIVIEQKKMTKKILLLQELQKNTRVKNRTVKVNAPTESPTKSLRVDEIPQPKIRKILVSVIKKPKNKATKKSVRRAIKK